jgi:putative membrane protein
MKNVQKMEHTKKLALFLIISSMACLSCNQSQSRTDDTKDPKDVSEEHNKAKFDNTAEKKDAKFLMDAAVINLTEIQLGRMAMQKGKSADVKDLGKMMEKEHRASEAELKALAAKKIITVPDSTTQEVQDASKKLEDVTGLEFDSKFSDMMVKGHKDAIALFEKESKEGDDADIKAWAQSTLPVLRVHLDHSLMCKEKCDKEKKRGNKNTSSVGEVY